MPYIISGHFFSVRSNKTHILRFASVHLWLELFKRGFKILFFFSVISSSSSLRFALIEPYWHANNVIGNRFEGMCKWANSEGHSCVFSWEINPNIHSRNLKQCLPGETLKVCCLTDFCTYYRFCLFLFCIHFQARSICFESLHIVRHQRFVLLTFHSFEFVFQKIYFWYDIVYQNLECISSAASTNRVHNRRLSSYMIVKPLAYSASLKKVLRRITLKCLVFNSLLVVHPIVLFFLEFAKGFK